MVDWAFIFYRNFHRQFCFDIVYASNFYLPENKTEWEMDAAIPVSGPGKDDGEIKAGKLKAGKAVMARFFGSYEQTGMAHQAADEFIKKNNKQVIGAPWEVYVTDPMVEKDTAKWETDIFYPVQ